jgi:hypothetical protein
VETTEATTDNETKVVEREKVWLNEPSFRKWIDPLTGLRCVIVRHPSTGHLNGYVRAPKALAKKLKAYERTISYRDPRNHQRVLRKYGYNHSLLKRVIVHGGLTFGGHFGFANGYWLGFDCNHAGDYAPKMAEDLTRAIREAAAFHDGKILSSDSSLLFLLDHLS